MHSRKPKKTQPETQAEQVERLKPLLGDRIMGGVIEIEGENAFFEVWAYRKLTDDETRRAFAAWRSGLGRGQSLRGQTFRVVANYGRELR
jgi:hypothetical protein